MVILLSTHAYADTFYVAYEWHKPDGSRIKSWNTGFINEDVDIEKGIQSLMNLLRTENGMESPIVILYLKKLKPEQHQSPDSQKPYINGQLI